MRVENTGPEVHQDGRVEAGQGPDNAGTPGSTSPHLPQAEDDGSLVLRHDRQAEDPGHREQDQADQEGEEGQDGGHHVSAFIRLLVYQYHSK